MSTDNLSMTNNSTIALNALNVIIQRNIDVGLITEKIINDQHDISDMLNQFKINTKVFLRPNASATSSADTENPTV